jgi:hypothetical protein
MEKEMLLILLLVPLLFGCTSVNASENQQCQGDTCSLNGITENISLNQSNVGLTQNENAGDNITVEMYHFHGTHQCYSCIRVGELAEQTVNTYFKGELQSGKLVFGHINAELPENKDLVTKYEATGSSLWIGTYVNGKFSKEQNTNVWYKIEDEKGYLEYLKGIIDKRLSGDLS